MTEQQLHTTCEDCTSLVQHAAAMIQSSDQYTVKTPYDSQYQSRLLANVTSSKCHMCTILHANIPQLILPFEPGERKEFWTQKLANDPLAAAIELCGLPDETRMFRGWPGRLGVQQGETWSTLD